MSLRRPRIFGVATALLVAAAVLHGWPAQASAQRDDPPAVEAKPLKADFKGAVGLGLIGAELGFVVPALAGATDAWAFIVFPIAGAAGGATAGYFLLEKGKGKPELAVAALVTGMALIVPAMVVTVAATAYEPDEDELSSHALPRVAARAGPGLLRLSERGLLLAPPGVAVVPAVERTELLAARGRSVRVSLFSGRF